MLDKRTTISHARLNDLPWDAWSSRVKVGQKNIFDNYYYQCILLTILVGLY